MMYHVIFQSADTTAVTAEFCLPVCYVYELHSYVLANKGANSNDYYTLADNHTTCIYFGK